MKQARQNKNYFYHKVYHDVDYLFVLLSAERHLAVKYSFPYDNLFTEVCIIVASGVGCDHVTGCAETSSKCVNLIARCCKDSDSVKLPFLRIILSKFICFYTNVNLVEN